MTHDVDIHIHEADPNGRMTPHRPNFRRWTADEWQKVIELRAQGHDLDYIAGSLHRTKAQLQEKIRWEEMPAWRRAEVNERVRLRRRQRVESPPEDKSAVSKATPEMLADRDRRLYSPRTITASLCGDPPVGYSMLDKRGQV